MMNHYVPFNSFYFKQDLSCIKNWLPLYLHHRHLEFTFYTYKRFLVFVFTEGAVTIK